MVQPLVVEYLTTHTLKQLEDEFDVRSRPSKNFDKFSLNYNEISPPGVKLSEQCRGLIIRPSPEFVTKCILSSEDEWRNVIVGNIELLAWPLNRFYNVDDCNAAKVDWSSAQTCVYEKLDGTMCILYWDTKREQWFVATRNVPEADNIVGGMNNNETFYDLFMIGMKNTYEKLTDKHIWFTVNHPDDVLNINKALTYVFELTSPHNKQVVNYNNTQITLLSARLIATGEELHLNEIYLTNVCRPMYWANFNDPVSLKEFVEKSDPTKLEGAVVCDNKFNRIKVKSKAYVTASRSKNVIVSSRRNALDAIIRGTLDDVLPFVSGEIATELIQLREKTKLYYKRVDDNFVAWKTVSETRKSFAEKVIMSNKWPKPYFDMWSGKFINALECITDTLKSGRMSTSMLDAMLKDIDKET